MLKIIGKSSMVNWTVGLARNIGGDIAEEGDGIDDGAAGILPEIQGRISTTLKNSYTIGFSGHFTQMDGLGDIGKYQSWSGNIDLNLAITPIITISGEAFLGSNIAGMLGGIANANTVEGVETQGGWINIKIRPNNDLTLSAGASLDDPCDDDLADGMRSKNTMLFANAYQNILQGFLLGIEISNWSTEYKNLDTATALRGQIAFLYKF
jgi:hypothetical protein